MPSKNKITTLGYFTKRLKDNGYIVWKIMDKYDHDTDYRKWTVLVNPSQESVMITCLINRDGLNELPCFDFYDGGRLFQKNFSIRTESMEVIVNHLIDHHVSGDSNKFRSDAGRT